MSDSEGGAEVEIAKDGVPRVKKVKEVRQKRPQTEAQKEATRKMLEALKAKRQAQKVDHEKDVEALDEVKREEAAVKAYEEAKKRKLKKLPPVPNYVTSTQIQLMEKRMIETMERKFNDTLAGSLAQFITPKAPEPVKPKEDLPSLPVAAPKPVIVKEPPKIISGNALLDSIFFK
jgi:hypothetical protein